MMQVNSTRVTLQSVCVGKPSELQVYVLTLLEGLIGLSDALAVQSPTLYMFWQNMHHSADGKLGMSLKRLSLLPGPCWCEQVVVLASDATLLAIRSPKSAWSHALLPRLGNDTAAATAAAAPSTCSTWGSVLRPNYSKLFLRGPGLVVLFFYVGAMGSSLLVYGFAAMYLNLEKGGNAPYAAFLLLLGR